MENEKIEIDIEGEEIPTNVRRLLKVLEVPGLSKDDREVIRDMIGKMNEVLYNLDSNRMAKPVSDKIDALRASIETEKRDINDIYEKFSTVISYLERERNISQAFAEDLAGLKTSIDFEKRNINELSEKFDKLVSLLDSDKERMLILDSKFDKLVSLLDSDKERAIVLNEKFDKLIDYISQDKATEILSGISSNLNTVLSSVQSNEERIVALFARTLDNLEGISRSLAVLHTDKTELDRKINAIVENVNEKFDAYMKNLNDRLDNMLLQILEPLNGVSMRLEEMKKFGDTDIKEDIRAMRVQLEDLKKFSETDIRAAVFAEITNNKDIKKLDSEIRKINTQLTLMRREDVMSRISGFKKLVTSYRVSKKAQPDKKRILKTLKFVEDTIVDIAIMNCVKNKTSMAKIKEEVKLSERELKQHINRLVENEKLKKERKGNYFVYSVVK